MIVEAYTAFCAQKDLTDKAFQKLLQINVSYQAFVKVYLLCYELRFVWIHRMYVLYFAAPVVVSFL